MIKKKTLYEKVGKSIAHFALLIFLSSCIAKNDIVVTLKNPNKKALPLSNLTISNVQVINHQIVITGTNLNAVSNFNIKEGSTTTNLQIESKSNTSIVANTLINVSFAAGKVFDFILSNASAASTFTINFSLCDSTLGTKGINCVLTPNDKDVLSYDATSGKWAPRAVNGLSYQGLFSAAPGTPPPANTIGDYYIINVAGTIGAISYSVGDWIVLSAIGDWEKINNTTGVTSVFGRTGAVIATEGDYNLNKLSDVVINPASLSNGKILKYNGTTFLWEVGDDLNGGGAGSVSDAMIVDVAASKITGTLPIANGGTGSTTQNFVDLTTAQTIAGIKTFSSNIVGNITGNAATVTTNANLTGDVTSVGNATNIGALKVTNAMLAGSIDLTTKVTGTLPIANGGSGITSGTQGGIPYFDTTTSMATSLLLGLNEIVLGGGSASPPAGLGTTGTAGYFLTSGGVGLAPNWTQTLAVANGGTGSTTKNFVDLTTAQSIAGAKTFGDATLLLAGATSGATTIKASAVAASYILTLPAATGTLALTSDISGTNTGTNTGDQTISLTGPITGSGTGSFATTITPLAITNAMIANGTIDLTTKVTGGLPIANGGTGSTTQNFVDLTTAQTIAGIKTFSSNIVGNITGNAATVTTNANLTGDVTSIGNATTIGAAKVNLAMLSASGTPDATKYLKGDNTWSPLAADVINSVLGTITADITARTAGDSILTAFNKTQGQLNTIAEGYVSKNGTNLLTGVSSVQGLTARLTVPTPLITDLSDATNVQYVSTAITNAISANGVWNKNVNDISYTTGNVGIGTTAPDSTLQVNGTIHSNELWAGQLWYADSSGLRLDFTDPNFANTSYAGKIRYYPTLTTAANNTFGSGSGFIVESQIDHQTSFTATGLAEGLEAANYVHGSNGGTITGLAGLASYYGISGGNVNTTNAYGVYIQGSHWGTGTINSAYGLYIEDTSQGGGTLLNNYGIYQKQTSAKNYFGGNVGIGTTAPSRRLDVQDNQNAHIMRIYNTDTTGSADGLGIRFAKNGAPGTGNEYVTFYTETGGTQTSYGAITGNSVGGIGLGTVSTFPLSLRTNGSDRMTIDSSGKVGIGMTGPSVALDVAGGIRPGSSTTVTACGLGQANGEGTTRYNYTSHAMEFCNGTSWVEMGTLANTVTGTCTNSGAATGNATCAFQQPVTCPVGHTATTFAYSTAGGAYQWNSVGTYPIGICVHN